MKQLIFLLAFSSIAQICAAQSVVGKWVPVNCYAIINGTMRDMTENVLKNEPDVEYTPDGKVISALNQGTDAELYETTYVQNDTQLLLTNVRSGKTIVMQISDFTDTTLTLSNNMGDVKMVRTFKRK